MSQRIIGLGLVVMHRWMQCTFIAAHVGADVLGKPK